MENPDLTLELTADEMRRLVAQVMEHLVAHLESLPRQPAVALEGGAQVARQRKFCHPYLCLVVSHSLGSGANVSGGYSRGGGGTVASVSVRATVAAQLTGPPVRRSELGHERHRQEQSR